MTMTDSLIARRMRLLRKLEDMGFTYEESTQLKRIESTLSRWAEQECGDVNGNAIERDEATGKPYRTWYSSKGDSYRARAPIPDREASALARLAKIMSRHPDLVSYHQSDPRGCMLYILRKTDLADGASIDSVYTRGLAICL